VCNTQWIFKMQGATIKKKSHTVTVKKKRAHQISQPTTCSPSLFSCTAQWHHSNFVSLWWTSCSGNLPLHVTIILHNRFSWGSSDDRRLCATEREWTYFHTCGNSIKNALWKQWEETNMSTAELKMVPGEEFIFKYTPSQICISKRWLQEVLASGQSNYNKSYG
jgi:hypothetical protein